MARKNKKPVLSSISLGPFSRLYSEDFFVQELSRFGVTRRGFRALCHALQVPLIEIGRTRFVDHLSFAVALRAISRIGRPDFFFPGSLTRSTHAPPPESVRLCTAHLEDHLTIILKELTASAILNNRSINPRTLTRAARDAARRMMKAGLASLPAQELEAHATRAPSIPLFSDPSSPDPLAPPSDGRGIHPSDPEVPVR